MLRTLSDRESSTSSTPPWSRDSRRRRIACMTPTISHDAECQQLAFSSYRPFAAADPNAILIASASVGVKRR